MDNLSKLAQQSLKSAMNTKRAIFILTTNNISSLGDEPSASLGKLK